MDMQKLVDTMNQAAQSARKNYHLTLGKAIKGMEIANPESIVEFDIGGSPGRLHSYRGYYCDLAFEKSEKPVTVVEFLTILSRTIGHTYEGYKGGDYTMEDDTPLWCSSYGDSSGFAIVGIVMDDGKVTLTTKEVK